MNPAKDGSFEEDLLFVDSSSMYLACIFDYLLYSMSSTSRQWTRRSWRNISTTVYGFGRRPPPYRVPLNQLSGILQFYSYSDFHDLEIYTRMAPKGGNAKKEGGRAKKAENEVWLPTSLPFSTLSNHLQYALTRRLSSTKRGCLDGRSYVTNSEKVWRYRRRKL